MVEFKLPPGDGHVITITQRPTGRFRADCSCGWGYAGTHNAVFDRVAVHNIDPYDEQFDQCDRCDRVVRKGEVACHRGVWLCDSCRGAPTEPEIERSQCRISSIIRR